MSTRRILLFVAASAAGSVAATAVALALQANGASIDRHNARYLGNALRAETPGWTCGERGCAARALQMNVVE